MRIARLVAAVTVLTLVAAACTGDEDLPEAPRLDFATTGPPGDEPAATGTGPTGAAAPGTPSDTSGLEGRLAVLAADGSLVTMAADGSERVAITEATSDRVQIQQPSWARDGKRLAWVRAELGDDGSVSASVQTASARGDDATDIATEVVPFYLSWDPTSTRIGYLGSPAEGAIEFGVVETGRGAGATALGDGSPFYLSWAPEGDELIAHVGRTELVRLALDGSTRDVDVPSVFNVPVWTPHDALIYGTGDERGQRLVVRDADAERSRTLVRFRAGLTFVVSPDGRRVAYQEVSPLGGGPLMMVDVASGETTEVADHLVAAYSWSPDGTKVLYLDPEGRGQDLAFRWVVWDGGVVVQTPRFVPSGLLEREYLPFFEQYAQSMTQWSPDSDAFAYAGFDEQGRAGIFVQEAAPDRAPVLVSDGEFVAWSPA